MDQMISDLTLADVRVISLVQHQTLASPVRELLTVVLNTARPLIGDGMRDCAIVSRATIDSPEGPLHYFFPLR